MKGGAVYRSPGWLLPIDELVQWIAEAPFRWIRPHKPAGFGGNLLMSVLIKGPARKPTSWIVRLKRAATNLSDTWPIVAEGATPEEALAAALLLLTD